MVRLLVVSVLVALPLVGQPPRPPKGDPAEFNLFIGGKRVASIRDDANAGDPEAQYNLGFYCEKKGPVAYPEALDWFRKAAYQGHARAQFYLGVSYEVGEIIPQDFVEAYAWYSVSAASRKDNGQDIEYRNRVAKRLSASGIERAQTRARKLHDAIQAKSPSL